MHYFRMDLKDYEFETLKKLLGKLEIYCKDQINDKDSDFSFYFNILKESIKNAKKINDSASKRIAMETATKARSKRTKEKIDNAVRLLRFQNEKLTHYKISKESGVSFQTVKKYISNDDLNTFNENIQDYCISTI